MKVEIQSKKWIKPETPTPFHLQKYKLSYIDQLQPLFFVEPIFYFNISCTLETESRLHLLHDLEKSLSKVLTLYYPFAGRYDYENESLLSCQDQGVAFVVANVDRELDRLVDGEYDAKLLLCDPEILQITSNDLLAMVQVNIFRCGGLAIGLSVSHKVGDMYTISTFMDAWATTCRLGTLDKLIKPSFGFSSLLPAPSNFNFLKRSNFSAKIPPNYVMKRYIFTGEAIAKLKSTICSDELSFTRVELVMAILTRTMTIIEPGQPKPFVVISQPMNFRSRTGLAIEENSCGNLYTYILATNSGHDQNGLLDPKVPEIAKLIKNSIKNVAAGMREVQDWSELGEKVTNATREFQEEMKSGNNNVLIFWSWCRFPLYEVDFGWGRPSLVSTVPVPKCIILMDCEKSGDIQALVCLKQEDVASFQQQPDILQYASF